MLQLNCLIDSSLIAKIFQYKENEDVIAKFEALCHSLQVTINTIGYKNMCTELQLQYNKRKEQRSICEG